MYSKDYNGYPLNESEVYTTVRPSTNTRGNVYPAALEGNYINPTTMDFSKYTNDGDERFIGPLAPFLLGGIAGAALAPGLFNRPCCRFPYGYPGAFPYGGVPFGGPIPYASPVPVQPFPAYQTFGTSTTVPLRGSISTNPQCQTCGYPR